MIIKKLEFKNINSYGNKLQEIIFGNEGTLINIRGNNGHGKCLSPDTIIDIDGDVDVMYKLKEFLKKNRI
ncbi:hypothetical protein M0Q50_04550 [bacterium]|jgi:hypothetical protein|nr:hypothetical protein [bacterium]